MACGLPVVSSSVGGLPELVRHNESGFIAEIGDVERMAKYTIELLSNEKKYTLFSENARQRAVTQFDTSKVVPMYEEYYERDFEKLIMIIYCAGPIRGNDTYKESLKKIIEYIEGLGNTVLSEFSA